MNVYGRYDFEKLIHIRDKYRDLFAKREVEIEGKYGYQLLEANRSTEKYSLFALLNLFAILFYSLILYKKFDNVLVLIGLGLLIALLGYFVFTYYRNKKQADAFQKLFDSENKTNIINKEKLEEYNYKATKCAILSICYSENFYTLESLSLKNKEEKLISLFLQRIRLIDGLNNNKATIDDYLNYYYDWERKYL